MIFVWLLFIVAFGAVRCEMAGVGMEAANAPFGISQITQRAPRCRSSRRGGSARAHGGNRWADVAHQCVRRGRERGRRCVTCAAEDVRASTEEPPVGVQPCEGRARGRASMDVDRCANQPPIGRLVLTLVSATHHLFRLGRRGAEKSEERRRCTCWLEYIRLGVELARRS